MVGLNDLYVVIRSQIIMKKHVPILDEIYNLMDQNHSQKNITHIRNDTAFQGYGSDSTVGSVNANH